MSTQDKKLEIIRLWGHVRDRSISKLATYGALNRQLRNSYRRSKLVTFTEEAADDALLLAVENELLKQPHKSFSDLCKESLRKSLPVPEQIYPRYQPSLMEQQIAEMQEKLASLERQVATREAQRLDVLESQFNQLALQQAQIAITISQRSVSIPSPEPALEPALEPVLEIESATHALPQQADPLLKRLSSLVDKF
jgi:hypothetical protein